MNLKAWKRILKNGAFIFVALMLPALTAWGYVPLRGPKGAIASWRMSRFPLIFQRSGSLTKSNPGIAPGSDVIAAIRAAMFSWQSVQTADIRFADLQYTSEDSGIINDSINLITIADTPVNRGILGVSTGNLGAVAQTRIVFDKNTGEIRECDIVLNPKYKFSTNLAFLTYDLQTILTHELGHALGCDHSSAQNDTMFSATATGEFFQRYLSADAIAFAGLTYPNPNQARIDSLGLKISGRITSAGAPVFGAAITAVNLDRNLMYASLSEPDGSYAVSGLAKGRYAIYAEPLDGPMTPDQLLVQGGDAYYKELNTKFRTFVAQEQNLGLEGAAKNIEVSIAAVAGEPSVNIDRMGRGEDPDSIYGYLSAGAVVVNPGERVGLWIGGSNTWKATNTSQIRILGSGITLDAAQGIRILRDGGGTPAGIIVQALVAPDAAPGPRTLLLQIGNEQVASTGGIVVSARTLPQTTLYFPYMKAAPDRYTGIALANSIPDIPAVVRMYGRDYMGALLWGDDCVVPSDFTLPPGSQWARLERQFFNLPFESQYSGSVTVESDAANLQGFFLTGDFACSYLDGAEAFTRGYRQLLFVDILQDANTSTEIHLMNVKDYAISVSLSLVGETGILKGAVQRTIAPGGKIGESVASLFAYSGDLHSAHLIALTEDDALAGFELITQAGEVSGLNALPLENAGSMLYSPQLVVGDLGLVMDTRLNLVNVGNNRAIVRVDLLDGDGLPLTAEPKTFEFWPGAHISFDVRSMFVLQIGQGYIKVTASEGAKLLGNVMFGSGDPTKESLKFGAAIPLYASGLQDFVFAHIAQGEGYYTGVAFLAPQGASITVQAYDNNGTAKGVPAMRDLAPGQRLVSLLHELVPETEWQVGGYVRVTSSQPVIAFELFGTADGQLLSAVPPQRLSK